MSLLHEPTSEELNALRGIGLRPQIVGCMINNKQLLFVYKEEHKLWQIPQGGIDNNETPQEALIREMTEELGPSIMKNASNEPILIAKEKIEFPPHAIDTKELFTDNGEKITMKGKFYFIYAVLLATNTIALQETEFDNTKWCTFAEANSLIASIYQKGKRRITQTIAEELYKQGMIE